MTLFAVIHFHLISSFGHIAFTFLSLIIKQFFLSIRFISTTTELNKQTEPLEDALNALIISE